MDINELIETYDIKKAQQRSNINITNDPVFRYIWERNEVLKNEIDACSYSGFTSADVDITTCSNKKNYIAAFYLEARYKEAGYKTLIEVLKAWGQSPSIGYRLHVSWEE